MKAHVAIDVRILEHAGIGTYIRNVVPPIVDARPEWHFTLLASPAVPDTWGRAENVSVVTCTSGVYTAREQIELRRKTPARVDLFWAPHYNIPLLIGAPLVVTVHDVCHLALPEYFSGAFKQWYAKSLFTAVRRRAEEIIFDSEFSRAEFERLVGTPKRSTTIHLGVAESWAGGARARRIDAPYLLFVGSARPHKNLAALLRAFELVSARIPHDLIIVGSLSNQRTTDTTAIQLVERLGNRVRVLDDVDDAALVDIVANADALVMPSLYEGFGLPALEAMAAGCPCLVSSAASLPEVCGDAAAFFDPRNPSDIARQITHVLEDSALRANLVAGGRARAAQFRWNSTAARTIAVLERALDRAR